MKRVDRIVMWLAILAFSLSPSAGLAALPTTPGRAVLLAWTVGESPSCTYSQLGAFAEAMTFWNVEGPNNYCYEENPYDDTPVITVINHLQTMNGARFLAMDTHGTNGWYAAEYFLTSEAATAKLQYYVDCGYDPTLVSLGTTSLGTPVLLVSNVYVEWDTVSLGSRAIADLSWCCSSSMANTFVTIGAASIMAYDTSPAISRICRNFESRWKRLGCQDDSYTSTVVSANQLPDAVLISGLSNYADSANSINPNYSCDNWAARFLDWGIDRDGHLLFLTNYERRSDAYYVYGFRGGERQTLAEIEPKGDESGRINVYEIDVPVGFDEYQIAEIDLTRMWRTLTERKRPGDFDPTLNEMRTFEGADLGEIGAASAGESRTASPGGQPVLQQTYGDAVIYTWSSSVATALLTQTQNQGLETVLYVGDGTQGDISATYLQTYNANIARNNELGYQRYPVWPGPELYLVGKASDLTVRTNYWNDDAYGNCNQPLCRGDYDYTDVDGDGRPNGPVARIFAESEQDVQRYVYFSDQYNGGGVDPNRRVLLCAGDYNAASDSLFRTPDLWLDKVETTLSGESGFGSFTRFRRSDYPSSSDASDAGANLINAGVFQIWAIGFYSSYKRIPSSVVYGKFYDVTDLTTNQAYVLYAPGCEVAADWGFASSYGLLLNKLMLNDPGKSGCAGAIAHWSGGWGEKHDLWASYVLKKYKEAEPGISMARLLWRAFIKCTDEAPWMVDYCRSAVYVGARTLVKQENVSVENPEQEQLLPTRLSFGLSPTIIRDHGCNIRFEMPYPSRVSLQIFDIRGRLVRTLVDRELAAGGHVSRWDTRNGSGDPAGSGIYFVRLSTERETLARKVTVLR